MIHSKKHLPKQSETLPGFQTDVVICVESCMSAADVCSNATETSLEWGLWHELRAPLRRNLDCADVCHATAILLSRRMEHDWVIIHGQLAACELACAACASANEKFADTYEHCRECANACRKCETLCRQLARMAHLPARSRSVA